MTSHRLRNLKGQNIFRECEYENRKNVPIKKTAGAIVKDYPRNTDGIEIKYITSSQPHYGGNIWPDYH